MSTFEGSKKDIREDAKMAKKRDVSVKDWEKSAGDAKHDDQRSTKGLKKGGPTSEDRLKYGKNGAKIQNQLGGKRG
jgi:hypothetical protein